MYYMKPKYNSRCKKVYSRGNYGEISLSELSPRMQKTVKNLINDVSQATKVDEHGNWAFGSTFDRKGRGQALNWDLYGIGRDQKTRRLLLVIQVRQFIRRKSGYYPQIRKNYFLIGKNEDRSTFAHAISAHAVHAAIRTGKDVIEAAQRWIFGGVEYAKVLRQGDIAMTPVVRMPKGDTAENPMTLLESHLLQADEIKKSGKTLFALNPKLLHLPKAHPEVTGTGWHRIIIGQRAQFWEFAAETVD